MDIFSAGDLYKTGFRILFIRQGILISMFSVWWSTKQFCVTGLTVFGYWFGMEYRTVYVISVKVRSSLDLRRAKWSEEPEPLRIILTAASVIHAGQQLQRSAAISLWQRLESSVSVSEMQWFQRLSETCLLYAVLPKAVLWDVSSHSPLLIV